MNALFGGTYSTHAKRVATWNQAAPIPGCDRAVWRCDDQGRIMRWADYDDPFSRYGWTIVQAPSESRLGKVLGRASAKAAHISQAQNEQPLRDVA